MPIAKYSKTDLCACGCGLPAPVAPFNRKARGWVKGRTLPYRVGHNLRVGRPDPSPRHYSKAAGSVSVHVAVAETVLGHSLPPGAQVHHVDGDRRNNRNQNLVVCQDQTYHRLLHHRTAVVRAGGNPNTDKLCGLCHAVKPLTDFNIDNANKCTGRHYACRECERVRRLRDRSAA